MLPAYRRRVRILTARDLVVGPRGRVLCMAVAHRLDARVWSTWLQAARNPGDDRRRTDLIRALHAVDAEPVRVWRDPSAFLDPIDETVSQAMYWQAPHDEDLFTARTDVIAALQPIAAAIAAAPASAWWTSPTDLTALRYTTWSEDKAAGPPPMTGAIERLTRWRKVTLDDETHAASSRPADPEAPFSGEWWSTPALTPLVSTTRPLPQIGSIQLVWQEDSLGFDDASIWSVDPIRPPRILEIDGPEAWVSLVERHPIDVTHARLHDWYRTTGRVGAWRIPDWTALY